MKTFLVLTATLAAASASLVQFSPALYTASIPITTQYHAQDGLGQYSYGYSGGPSAKAEYKSLDGVTRGSYSYVDADGQLQTVQYTADSANGFQASATNLPRAPVDDKTAPQPVEDTPEVAMAKAQHFAAFREAELRAAEQPDNGNNGNDDQDDQSANRQQSQEQLNGLSRENTSAETESPNESNGSSEQSSEQLRRSSSSQSSNGNGNNGISRLSISGLNSLSSLNSGLSSSLTSSLGLNGGLSSSLNNGLSITSLNSNNQLTAADLDALRSIQLNSDLTTIIDNNNDGIRLSDITPATTSQLRPISLNSVRLPATSYLRVSTPTHGYSVVSPTILTAVPTLRATSSQTISRTLPISLTSSFLTKGLL